MGHVFYHKILKHGSMFFLTEPKFLGFRMAKTPKITKFLKNGPIFQEKNLENGYPFLPKSPLKMGRGFEAREAHPCPTQIWVTPRGQHWNKAVGAKGEILQHLLTQIEKFTLLSCNNSVLTLKLVPTLTNIDVQRFRGEGGNVQRFWREGEGKGRRGEEREGGSFFHSGTINTHPNLKFYSLVLPENCLDFEINSHCAYKRWCEWVICISEEERCFTYWAVTDDEKFKHVIKVLVCGVFLPFVVYWCWCHLKNGKWKIYRIHVALVNLLTDIHCIQGRSQTLYTTPCNGVISHGDTVTEGGSQNPYNAL